MHSKTLSICTRATALLALALVVAATALVAPSNATTRLRPIASAPAAADHRAAAVRRAAAPVASTSQTKASAHDVSRSDLPAKETAKAAKRAKGAPARSHETDAVAAVPANDDCANAIAVDLSADVPFTDTQDTSMATDEMGEPASPCTTQSASVWYTVTNPTSHLFGVDVSLCDSDFDTAVMVWSVDPMQPCDFASFVAVACNDDSTCGDGLQSTLTFLAQPGETYKIQAGGFDDDRGSLTMSITAQEFLCPETVINGTLGSGDPDFPGTQISGLQTGRLNRNGVVSSCDSPKTCNIFDAGGDRAYDAYELPNLSGADQCVIISLGAAEDVECNMQSNAYLNTYDPANICTGFLGDPGSSLGTPPTPTTFSAVVPAGQTLIVVVHTTNPGESGCAYTLSVLSNLCQTATIECSGNVTVAPTFAVGCTPSAQYTYPTPTASTECPGGNLTVTCEPESGSVFPMGTTVVTCTATDDCGGLAQCSFAVTVSDPFAAGNGVCVVDDLSGDTFSEAVAPGPLRGFWHYHVAATGEDICGLANKFTYQASRSLVSSDTNYSSENPFYYMDANVNFGTKAATVTVSRKGTSRKYTLRDRNITNDPPCSAMSGGGGGGARH